MHDASAASTLTEGPSTAACSVCVHECVIVACRQSLAAAAAAYQEERPPLADITNIQPLNLGIPLRRTASTPSTLPSYMELQRTPFSPLTALERAAAAVLVADHQPLAVVAAKLQTTPRTARRWAQMVEDQDGTDGDYRPGKFRALDSEQMEAIVDMAIANPQTTPRQIKREMDLHVSARTVRRVLDEGGLFGRITRTAPPLKEEHIKKRLAFADGYKNWKTEQWERVLWSDEMSIRVGPQGQHWCQRLINTEWFPSHVVEKEKHAAKVHVWACFSGTAGVGHIQVFEENLDSELMVDILKKHLLPSAKPLMNSMQKGMWYYQQDNDPKHKSKLVQGWLQQKGITCLDWPPYSPDLNPIENLWADLKRRVEEENARTTQELKAAVLKAWSETDDELIAKLVESMPRRLAAVHASQGLMTGY